MYRSILTWFSLQDPMTVILIVLIVIDVLLHIQDYARKKLAPRRCQAGFHTCSNCAIVLAVVEHRARTHPAAVPAREVQQEDLPPGMRNFVLRKEG